jgi:hypothetical protein
MYNKRKRNIKDPSVVNKYNKFLSTLDQKSEKINSKEETDKIETDKKENYTEKEKKNLQENMKKIIDNIIKNLDVDFSQNNINSENFTGQTINDTHKSTTYNDPNDYKDISQEKIAFNNMKKIIGKLNRHTQSLQKNNSCCSSNSHDN